MPGLAWALVLAACAAAALLGLAILAAAVGRRLVLRLSRRIAADVEARVAARVEQATQEIVNATALSGLATRLPIFLGGPSIDAFHARTLVQQLVAQAPRTVVELGSGSSTLLIAHVMRLVCAPGYRHIAVDHEAQFLELTRRQAAANGMAEHIEFRLCPLVAIPPLGLGWYGGATDALGEGSVDLLVVDGPPAYRPEEAMARYPAVPMLYRHLSARCAIILDDANRSGERDVVERWLREYPDLSVMRLPEGKGLAVLTRQP